LEFNAPIGGDGLVLSINLPSLILSNDERERDDIEEEEDHLINLLLL